MREKKNLFGGQMKFVSMVKHFKNIFELEEDMLATSKLFWEFLFFEFEKQPYIKDFVPTVSKN